MRPANLLILAATFLLGTGAEAQTYQGQELVKAQLVTETGGIVPGQPFTVGLWLKIAPEWHTYWQYPGDSGLPASIEWELPAGFIAGEIQWPLPGRFVEPGDLVTYAYADEVLLIVQITPPGDLRDPSVTLKAKARWLVCKQSCVPGDGAVELTLPVVNSSEKAAEHSELFARYRALLPKTGATPFEVSSTAAAMKTVFEITGMPDEFVLEFYPLPAKPGILDHPTVTKSGAGSWTITVPLAEGASPLEKPLQGVLVTRIATDPAAPREGWLLTAGSAGKPPGGVNPQSNSSNPPLPSSGRLLLKFLGLGFVGGLILNLMPCVLPVIALKIFGFMNQAGDDPRKIFRLGLAFIAGVFAWFLGLAMAVTIFKLVGHELNWAFQFQNPYALTGMTAIVFLFALNLLGVFEITLSTDANSKLSGLSNREGYGGAFFHGVFTTLLGTSCTAPFLGSALGFAFAQPPPITFGVFASVAAGMSLPYFLLTARPAWMRYLPKPGLWMERVKQFMGFLLLAVVVWLLWTLGQQRGVDDMSAACALLLGLAIAAWIKGAFVHGAASQASRWIGFVVMLALVIGFYAVFIGNRFQAPLRAANDEPATDAKGGTVWTPFTDQSLRAALAQNRVVFVDFTASWCLNCKVNERFVLDTPTIRDAFARNNVATLKADYSNYDPEITRILKSFGRIGVPLYVVYRAGSSENAIVLPELISKNGVLEALGEAASP